MCFYPNRFEFKKNEKNISEAHSIKIAFKAKTTDFFKVLVRIPECLYMFKVRPKTPDISLFC